MWPAEAAAVMTLSPCARARLRSRCAKFGRQSECQPANKQHNALSSAIGCLFFFFFLPWTTSSLCVCLSLSTPTLNRPRSSCNFPLFSLLSLSLSHRTVSSALVPTTANLALSPHDVVTPLPNLTPLPFPEPGLPALPCPPCLLLLQSRLAIRHSLAAAPPDPPATYSSSSGIIVVLCCCRCRRCYSALFAPSSLPSFLFSFCRTLSLCLCLCTEQQTRVLAR